MEEVVAPEVVTPEAEPQSGLPSDTIAQDYSGFELTDEQKAGFKNSKLAGRFESVDQMAGLIKELEDKFANDVRLSQNDPEVKAKAEAEAVKKTQQEVIGEMTQPFLDNDMHLTAEMETKAKEAGIDVRDLKIEAMELRERTAEAHALVGGKEEYIAMITTMAESLSDADKDDFNQALQGNMGKFAIMGLHSEYKKIIHNDPERLSGSATSVGIKPYSTRRELFEDKRYVESAAGRRDTAAQRNYRARLNATPDETLYGR